MKWDVIVRYGDSDNFIPSSLKDARLIVSFNREADPYSVPEKIIGTIHETIHCIPSDTTQDLLNLVSCHASNVG